MTDKARRAVFAGPYYLGESTVAGVLQITVTADEAGQKLLQFLQRRLGKDVPKSAVMRWIRTGQVRVNKGRAKPFDRLNVDDVVRVPPHAPGTQLQHNTAEHCPEHCAPQAVLAEQNDAQRCRNHGLMLYDALPGLLILHKPAGLPVQPGTGHTDAVTTRLAAAFSGASFLPTPAHRLDKDTSGLLLVATSYQCLQDLHRLFRDEHALEKTYLTWVQGLWPHAGPIRLEDTLAKQNTTQGERVVRMPEHHTAASSQNAAKHAVSTVYPVLRRKAASLLAVRIHTGRTHQIRVQLAGRGYPIVGDAKYGARDTTHGMLLHAWRLTLPPESAAHKDARQPQTFSCLPEWAAPYAVAEKDVEHLP